MEIFILNRKIYQKKKSIKNLEKRLIGWNRPNGEESVIRPSGDTVVTFRHGKVKKVD
jgi:hypothetical protein